MLPTEIETAEMVKYADNGWHALKVGFANEIGSLCKALEVDAHKVMEIFCQDRTLNLSPYYLKPGFAFGGSCLPKDLRGIIHRANQLELESPLLRAILISNNKQIDMGLDLIRKTGRRKIGVLGLSFKPGTDDMRESPMVDLIERLIGKGYAVRIYDREVSLARIFGGNKRYIEEAIPHIAGLMCDSIQEVV